jgi:hypothetical protein
MGRRLLIAGSTIVALLVGIPSAAEPGGRFGIGRGAGVHHGIRAPHGVRRPSLSPSFSPFLEHRPFLGHHPFGSPPFSSGGGVVVADPHTVYVITLPAPAALPAPVAPPAEAGAPDPKFIVPPPPSSESAAGSHAVIVQRGSKTETVTFPIDR